MTAGTLHEKYTDKSEEVLVSYPGRRELFRVHLVHGQTGNELSTELDQKIQRAAAPLRFMPPAIALACNLKDRKFPVALRARPVMGLRSISVV